MNYILSYCFIHIYILYIYKYVCDESLQSCPTICDPMDCRLQGSSVHGILQARILAWATGQQTVENSYMDSNTRSPYLPPEKPVCRSRRNRAGHRIMDWFKIGKEVHQGCILLPCLFNVDAEYIMQNFRLDESRAGTKIDRRNINNLRYADDTTLMAES